MQIFNISSKTDSIIRLKNVFWLARVKDLSVSNTLDSLLEALVGVVAVSDLMVQHHKANVTPNVQLIKELLRNILPVEALTEMKFSQLIQITP
mgnify:FL=1